MFLHCIVILIGCLETAVAVVNVELAIPQLDSRARIAAQIPVSGPTFELAAELCNGQYADILNFTATNLVFDNDGNAATLTDTAVDLIAQWYYQKRLDPTGIAVILSPAGLNSGPIYQMTTAWNILYFETTLQSSRRNYEMSAAPILVTANSSPPQYARTFVSLLGFYDWKTIFLVHNVAAPFFFRLFYDELLRDVGADTTLVIRARKIEPQTYSNPNSTYTLLLEEFRRYSRVMIFLGHPLHVRELLISASLKNMTTGEYVYLAYAVHWSLPQFTFGNLTWRLGDQLDNIAKEAFRSLIVVQQFMENPAIDTDQLLATVRQRAASKYGLQIRKGSQLVYDVLSDFATMEMLAQVLNESLASKGKPFLYDAYRLAPRFLQRSFTSDYSEIYLDHTGVRGVRQAVINFIGNNSQSEIVLLENKVTSDFQVIKNLSDYWPGGLWPPLNEPVCGYDGTSCLGIGRTVWIADILAIVLVTAVGLIVALFVYRHWYLSWFSSWWQVDPSKLIGKGFG